MPNSIRQFDWNIWLDQYNVGIGKYINASKKFKQANLTVHLNYSITMK